MPSHTFGGWTNTNPVIRETARPHITQTSPVWGSTTTRTTTSVGTRNTWTRATFTNNNTNQNQKTRGNNDDNRNQTTHGNNGNDGVWSHVQRYNGNHDRDFRTNYDHRGNGINFSFGLYLTAPTETCVVSPWYNYSVLPAYLPENVVSINQGVACNWNAGTFYNMSGGYASNAALNNAVSNIEALFENQSTSALDALIPDSGQVNIFNGGSYMYSLNDSDFRQMMEDNIQNTETSSFEITNILADGGQATVNATHTFTDPNGGTQTVYQQYRLQLENGRYVIVDFTTHA
jgi:hypothetical protein